MGVTDAGSSFRARCRRALLWLFTCAAMAGPGLAAAEPFLAHGGPVKDLEFEPTAARLLSVGFDYSLVVWDADRGAVVARSVVHDGPLNDVTVVPGRGLAVTASDDATLAVIDIATARAIARLSGHQGKVAAVAVSPDGTRVASAGWDGSVRLWSLAESREIGRVGDPSLHYTGVVFIGPDVLMAADEAGGLTRWDIAQGRVEWRIPGNGFPLTRLLARGAEVYTGSIDGTIRGWSALSGEELFRLEGQEKPVLSLALSPDGKWLASGTAAGTIYLWHVAERRGERVLRAEGGPTWSLAFSADGRLVYSGHGDGAIRVFEVATGRQLAGPAALHLAASDRLIGDGRGAQLFRKCVGCHSLTPDDENKAGPTFYQLIGRRAGSVPGYPYSAALTQSDIVWTEETLSKLFELGPETFVPGSRMPLQRLPNPADRAALVAYIARVSGGAGGTSVGTEGDP